MFSSCLLTKLVSLSFCHWVMLYFFTTKCYDSTVWNKKVRRKRQSVLTFGRKLPTLVTEVETLWWSERYLSVNVTAAFLSVKLPRTVKCDWPWQAIKNTPLCPFCQWWSSLNFGYKCFVHHKKHLASKPIHNVSLSIKFLWQFQCFAQFILYFCFTLEVTMWNNLLYC